MSDNYDFIMVVAEGCGHCASAKKGLEKMIGEKFIDIMDVTKSKEALNLAKQYGINAVPTIIVKDKKTGIGEACELREDFSGVICKDKEVDF
ncbi:MAG: glutaredoxin family protein [Candidatus Thorarchaeota archaeon]